MLFLPASSNNALSISSSRLGPCGFQPRSKRARSPCVCALVPRSTEPSGVSLSAASGVMLFVDAAGTRFCDVASAASFSARVLKVYAVSLTHARAHTRIDVHVYTCIYTRVWG